MPFRATFYLNLTLTYVVLNLILVCVEHVKSWIFQLFFRVSHWDTSCSDHIVIFCSFVVLLVYFDSFDKKVVLYILTILVYWFKWTWNSWVHFISLLREMRMYSLKSYYYGPFLFFFRRRYCQPILFVEATFLCTMSLEARKLYASSLLLLQIRHRRQRHTLTNAHRLWACRGMPFDDVCQIAPQGAQFCLGGRVF